MLRPAPRTSRMARRGERLEEARYGLHGRALNPLHVRGARSSARRRRKSSARRRYAGLYEDSASSWTPLADQCRELLDATEELCEDTVDRLLRAASGSASTRPSAWDIRARCSARQWDDAFPADRMLPALEATLADLGIDLRAQRNIELDLEPRPQQVAAGVLLADRGAGTRRARASSRWAGRRLAGALPRGRPRRALRAHLARPARRGAAARRRRRHRGLGDAAQHLVDEPEWLKRRLDFPRPDEFAAEGAIEAPLHRPALQREAPLRARAAPGRRPDGAAARYVELLSRRARRSSRPGRLPGRRRPRLLRHRRTSARGRSRRSCATILRERVRQRLVLAPRGRLAAARAVGAARSRQPTSCSAR